MNSYANQDIGLKDVGFKAKYGVLFKNSTAGDGTPHTTVEQIDSEFELKERLSSNALPYRFFKFEDVVIEKTLSIRKAK